VQSDDINSDTSPAESVSPATEASTSTETSVSESKGENSKESLLEAVLQVVPATNEEMVEDSAEEDAPPASEEKPEESDQAEAEDDKKDETDESSEDDEQAPPEASAAVRKKVNKLLKQRRELRNEVTQLKPAAEIGAQLTNFATSHQLGSDDVINALHIAATLRRGDYKSFYDMVAPYVRHAQEYLGVVLPQDLQQMVEQQQMTEYAAREYARTRFDQQRTQIENQRMQEYSKQYVTGEVRGYVARAVSDFESQLAVRDPDYKAKAGFVEREARALLHERGGSISTPQEAIDIVNTAYATVNAQFRKFAQPARATAPSPGGANKQTPSARPAPKTMMEAALMGLQKTRAG
jgi:hypothetical protein